MALSLNCWTTRIPASLGCESRFLARARRRRRRYAAHDEVKRNLGRLIDLGQLRLAMELSQELMDQGSHQVEMSDEGLMTDDVEECLQVIVKALQKSDLPPAEIVAWCKAMTKRDRVGFIYDRELQALQHQFEASDS
jgi:hypothetical protein